MKKLRRKGIAAVETANAFLDEVYWPEHNRRFAQAPALPDDFHVAVPRGVQLEQVFRLEETRTVSNDWVVRYDKRFFQLERQNHRPPARGTVRVLEDAAGQAARLLVTADAGGSNGPRIRLWRVELQRSPPPTWTPPSRAATPARTGCTR